MKVIKAKNIDKKDPIGIVVSRFNSEITDELLKGCLQRLNELEVSKDMITVVYVPGVVEAPFLAQKLLVEKKMSAVIVLGCVIRGETSHYDYVCEQVSNGCQRVALDHNLPVVFGVLTTENEEQAKERIGGSHGHKGRDAADTAMEMLSVVEQLA